MQTAQDHSVSSARRFRALAVYTRVGRIGIAPSGGGHSNDPGLLQPHRNLTTPDWFVLDTLYKSSRKGICSLSNQEIIYRSGVKGQTEESLRMRLRKLEDGHWLTREGSNQNRKIRLHYKPVPDEKPLIVDLEYGLTPSQQIVLSVVNSFTKTKKWQKWADFSRMSLATFSYNFRRLFGISPCGCTKSCPQGFLKLPPRFFKIAPKVFSISSEEGTERVSNELDTVLVETDNKLSVAMVSTKPINPASLSPQNGRELKNPSTMKAALHSENKIYHCSPECSAVQKLPASGDAAMQLPPRRPYKQGFDDPRNIHAALKQQATGQNKKSGKLILEVEKLSNYKYISKPRSGSKSYQNTARILHALRIGLVNCPDVMPQRRADQMKKFMVERFGFTIAQVGDFLTRKFGADDRALLLQHLDDNFNPDYDGLNGGSKNLASALWSYSGTGFSLLCKVWVEPPKLKAPREPELAGEVAQVAGCIAKAVGEAKPDYNIARVAKAVAQHFQTELVPYSKERLPREEPNILLFLADMSRWMNDELFKDWPDRHRAWRDYEPDGKVMRKFVTEWKWRIEEKLSLQRQRQREQKEEQWRYQQEYEDTMRGCNW